MLERAVFVQSQFLLRLLYMYHIVHRAKPCYRLNGGGGGCLHFKFVCFLVS